MVYAISCDDVSRLNSLYILLSHRYLSHLESSPNILFVSAPKTAKEIYDEIAAEEGEGATIVILGIQTYYGWASPQLWEWLHVQLRA